jgi:hypothetical protein
MSNSPLISYTQLAPAQNTWGKRTAKITKITPHHAAGVLSVESLCGIFSDPGRGASANYCISNDGRIGLVVEERNTAGTSSNYDNDNQAVTIEVSNCENGGQWRVSDAAYHALIDLCVDICKRNGMAQLHFTGDANGNLTAHRMFAATTCPGPYLYSKFAEIEKTVNERLQEDAPMTTEEKQAFTALQQKVTDLEAELDQVKNDENTLHEQVYPIWGYIDNNLPQWAAPTIEKLYKNKILQGNETGNLELSYLMLRMLVILDRSGCFGDAWDISEQAQEEMKKANVYGVMDYSDPQQVVSRAKLAAVASRIIDKMTKQ